MRNEWQKTGIKKARIAENSYKYNNYNHNENNNNREYMHLKMYHYSKTNYMYNTFNIELVWHQPPLDLIGVIVHA